MHDVSLREPPQLHGAFLTAVLRNLVRSEDVVPQMKPELIFFGESIRSEVKDRSSVIYSTFMRCTHLVSPTHPLDIATWRSAIDFSSSARRLLHFPPSGMGQPYPAFLHVDHSRAT